VVSWRTFYLMAGLTVLMACALECAKPLAVVSALSALRNFAVIRGGALALLALVAVAYSLTAELSLMATARTDHIAQRTADSKAAKIADGQRTRIDTELARLSGMRPSATIKAEIDGTMLGSPRRRLQHRRRPQI
jgi:hypothetical protein